MCVCVCVCVYNELRQALSRNVCTVVCVKTIIDTKVCVFYYCRTYYKAVRVGGGGEWRTCAMRDDEPRPV